jgi:hypothetical protein
MQVRSKEEGRAGKARMIRRRTAVLLLAGSMLAGCTAQPTGSAAHLYETRPDAQAASLAAADPTKLTPKTSDLDEFESEVAWLPDEAIVTNQEALDDPTAFIATQYRIMKDIVRSYQQVLENYHDVGTFLSANFSKSPPELEAAIRDFDQTNPTAPIGPRFAAFKSAQQTIFDRNNELTDAIVKISAQTLDPMDWFSAGAMSAMVVLDEAVKLPARILGLVFCPGCEPVDTGRIQICKNGDCVERSIKEQRALQSSAIDRASHQRQATVNAYVYIRYIGDKLSSIHATAEGS